MRERDRSSAAAIYPNPHGFAFVIFEGPSRPVDWGLKQARVRCRNARCLKLAETLLSQYQPQDLVIEDYFARRTRRCLKVRRLNRSLAKIGERLGISVHLICRAEVRQCFAGSHVRTKFEIATTISQRFNCFEHWMPQARKPGMPEDLRMSLFDAAALALAHYHKNRAANEKPHVHPAAE